MLKNMIFKFMQHDAPNWDKWFEPPFFKVQVQASTGAELLYRLKPGVLDVVQENSDVVQGPSQSKDEI